METWLLKNILIKYLWPYDPFELTQEYIEIKESGILDTWDKHDELIDVDINQINNHTPMILRDNSDSLTDDSKKKMLPLPKVSEN